MTAPAASAPARVNQTDADWSDWAAERVGTWSNLRRSFRGLVVKFSVLAFVCVAMVIFVPGPTVAVGLALCLSALCLANAVWCRVESEWCGERLDWLYGLIDPARVNEIGER